MRIKTILWIFLAQFLFCSLFYFIPYEKTTAPSVTPLVSASYGDKTIVVLPDEETKEIIVQVASAHEEKEETYAQIELQGAFNVIWLNDEEAQLMADIDEDQTLTIHVYFDNWRRGITIFKSIELTEVGKAKEEKREQQRKEEEEKAQKQNEEEIKQRQKKIKVAKEAGIVEHTQTITVANQIKDTYLQNAGSMQDQIGHDAQIYHAALGTKEDIKIEAGVVSVTQNGGKDWVIAPINGERLQNHWEKYFRLRDGSVYIDDKIIMIAHTLQYTHPHILVSKDQGKSWQDIQLRVFDSTTAQVAINQRSDGQYQITLISKNQQLSYGTSKDGLTWSFEKTYTMPVDAGTFVSMGLMRDGAIVLASLNECSTSIDSGKSYTHMSDKNPELAKKVNSGERPVDQDGVYEITLLGGKAISKDRGVTWQKAS